MAATAEWSAGNGKDNTMYGTDTNFKQVKFGAGSTILTSRGEAITLDAIAENAPAVFAEAKHDSRSERYEFLNTRTVLEGLIEQGFEVHEVRQGGSRIEGKREFTKHMLRLRYRGEPGSAALVRGNDQVLPELVITNAHDGTASWQLGAGAFRIICTNGLIGGELFEYQRISHSKNAPEKVIEGAFRVIEQFPRIIDGAREMAEVNLSDEERLVFANAARSLRWDGVAPIEPPVLLRAKRPEDRLTDLWTTMNVVQEHVIRGADGYTRVNPTTGRTSHRATGEIRGIDDNNRLNRALWTLAEGMAKLKAA